MLAADATRRIAWLTVALGAGGTLVLLFWKGLPWALGYLLGAAISLLNFAFFRSIAEALGPTGTPPARGSRILLILRLLIVGAVVFAMMKFSGVALAGVLTGLFCTAAAVLLEILYELFYARV